MLLDIEREGYRLVRSHALIRLQDAERLANAMNALLTQDGIAAAVAMGELERLLPVVRDAIKGG